jgi:formamidopyrimidine-DNA glycosylase
MIELPESLALAEQLNSTIRGKRIINVIAAQTPHKFAWYYGDPQKYHELLTGKMVGKADGIGSMVEIPAEDAVMLFGDGAALRYYGETEQKPQKHQMLVEFEDFSVLCVSVQMYGGLQCFRRGELDNKYYRVAKEKPTPLSDKFDRGYFDSLLNAPDAPKLSAKAFLATEQRIPGLGNGVLQDILYHAKIHPKRKINTLSAAEKDRLFGSIRETLAEMTFKGGRDTEKDLFGCPGGYITHLSKNTLDKPCPVCGGAIKKESYMGGSIYYCEGCQKA